MLTIEGLTKKFGVGRTQHQALRGVHLEVKPGELFTLLGPSGCGKTTCLRSVAGLEVPDAGSIHINNRTVYSGPQRVNVPVHRRPIGMVFQSYAIWPHMSVMENVAYPLKAAKVQGEERRSRVLEALRMVGLDHLGSRPATDLSGGQQQRVAFARAVVRDSDLLLFDEPLSNLDAKLRVQMRLELRELMQRLGRTALFVTHDQEEALTISDRIAVMRDGEVLEIGTPEELYLRPRTEFAARFLGQGNFFTGRLEESVSGQTSIHTEIGRLSLATRPPDIAEPGLVLVRSEHVSIEETSPSPSVSVNSARGTVSQKIFSGRFAEYVVEVGGRRVHVQTSSQRQLPVGAEVFVGFPPEHCVVLAETDSASGSRPPPVATRQLLADSPR